MAVQRSALALLSVMLFLAVLQFSEAVVYKVGDSTGWTILGNYNYTAWSEKKTFRVGDVVVFTYKKEFHNVMQVSHEQYNSCNASAPVMTLATGNDSITIKKTGHLYFLCGVPGHCQAGQKVDIRVPGSQAPAGSPAGSPTDAVSPSPTSSDATTHAPGDATTHAPGPSPKSDAPLPYNAAVGLASLAVALFAGCVAF